LPQDFHAARRWRGLQDGAGWEYSTRSPKYQRCDPFMVCYRSGVRLRRTCPGLPCCTPLACPARRRRMGVLDPKSQISALRLVHGVLSVARPPEADLPWASMLHAVGVPGKTAPDGNTRPEVPNISVATCSVVLSVALFLSQPAPTPIGPIGPIRHVQPRYLPSASRASFSSFRLSLSSGLRVRTVSHSLRASSVLPMAV